MEKERCRLKNKMNGKVPWSKCATGWHSTNFMEKERCRLTNKQVEWGRNAAGLTNEEVLWSRCATG
jgi:hypothetical protein